ncbi:coiled-coil domain-containing glutamate-rich protein 2 isoform X2 [Rhineura floridana]|uniref:coiled-coil domain-containing glutamate-rich protein 2 isoform X2 n=1 Tax=Rhineura floridana TaxID=261503 RepID=UPI002AC815AC|nr:coiled-coil domain-containing glutamate-rich protein 2 isoform X2 [Rhineura floridana]
MLLDSLALPLAAQLSEEDEKVTKCITEILADTLSKPSPIPVTSECMKILQEDERVLAMLHHQHLLTELEELAHQENAKHHLGHEGSHDVWQVADEQEDVKKRDVKPTQQREAASEKMQEQNGQRKKEEQQLKELEKTEKNEEVVKEEEVSQGEDNWEALEEQAKAVMEKEKEESDDEDEVRKKKKRSSSETWSSKEYFGLIKKRGPGHPKIREGMLRRSQDGRKRNGLGKRHFRLEEEDEDDSSEEQPKKNHHGGYRDGHHHREDWGEEEERSGLAKRVAEKASDEETAQFEEEEKGMKISNSQSQLHGGWKPWQEVGEEEEEEEGKMRHRHHHKPAGLDLKKRHQNDEVYLKGGRQHGHEEDEEEREGHQNEVQELEKLEEIKQELERATEKLEELKRGQPLPP